jgi:hypothetical protein
MTPATNPNLVSGSSPPFPQPRVETLQFSKHNWTWPFELEGKTWTDVVGPHITKSGNAQRQKNRWNGDLSVKPTYPIYVLSRGRWNIDKTWRVLNAMQVPHSVVIEPQEYPQYAEALAGYPYSTILPLPENFRETYRGESQESGGGIPARNFIWEHSIAQGAKRHWIMDDNLHCFQRMTRRERQELWTGAGFKATEDFVDRYTNVALAGPQYIMFATPKTKKAAYNLNTRIYSCILIKNDLPYRWRGRYNEDTDLSLRALKDGWVTVLSNAFLVDKTKSGDNAGGNTSTIYGTTEENWQRGREAMADSLIAQHPDVTSKKRKFTGGPDGGKRWQHVVNYKPFAGNKLVKIDPLAPEIISDYGLVQEHVLDFIGGAQ